MVSDKYRAKSWDSNLNLVVFFSLVLSGIGVTWLALNDVPAGIRYITIFLVGISFLTVSFLFITENNKETIKTLIRIPFETDLDVGVGLYALGWAIPIGLSFITSMFGTGFNVAQVMVPLSLNQVLTEISQSFSVAQASSDPFWTWFITVFTAGSIEEFVFGFILMLVGVIIAMLIWQLLFGQNTAHTSTAKWFYTIFGITLSALIFGGAHQLNGSYVGYMFIVAIAFRFAMNWLLYGMGFFLSFTLGYHQSNNAVYYWTQFGPTATYSALGSLGGILILSFFVLIIFYLLRNNTKIFKKIKDAVF